MMKNSYFQVLDVVGYVSNDRNTHDEDFEFDIQNLTIKFFFGSPFKDLIHFQVSLLLLSHFGQFVLFFTFKFSPFNALCHLP